MKLQSTYTFLLAVCVFSVLSCSDNDDKIDEIMQPIAPTEANLLVKKTIQTTYSNGANVSVTNYTYLNNQLTGTTTTAGPYTYHSVFHYDGNKITSVDYTQNGLSDGTTTFHYNGDMLSYTLSGENQNLLERTSYTFSNGHVATAQVYYPEGPDAELLQSSSYLYENGNVAEELRSTFWFGDEAAKFVYTYDVKNNPFKGLNPYLKLVMSNEGFNGLSTNNPLTRKVFSPIGENTPEEYYYDLDYNADNYPTSIKRYDSNDTLISETVIEYQ